MNKTNKFIFKATLKHGNKYDYTLVEYKTNKTKVCILCPTHGIFYQTPHNHLSGFGCVGCGIDKNTKLNRGNTENFIERSILKHDNKYDYSLSKYINKTTKVIIICHIHGKFDQLPGNHLKGMGCAKCGRLVSGNKHSSNTEEFISKAVFKHNDKYDYSLVEYKINNIKIKIKCKTHNNIFEQTPSNHLSGKTGCCKCKESKGEKLIEQWLLLNNIEFKREVRIRDFSVNKPFDFYLPKYDLYVEYDGIQHFQPMTGRKEQFIKQQINDNRTNDYCLSNGIHLLRISYKESMNMKLRSYLKIT
jgi:very-short-patch-repair endonuclease